MSGTLRRIDALQLAGALMLVSKVDKSRFRHSGEIVFGSTNAFPVSSQSTDLPNSWLIASSTAAPGSFSPRSSADR